MMTPAINEKLPANYVGGELARRGTVESVEVTNPATSELLASVPLAAGADVDKAIAAAAETFPTWRRTPAGTHPIPFRL